MAKKQENTISATMAQALAGNAAPEEKKEATQAEPVPAKPRRKSYVEKDLLPEIKPETKKKRQRRKKDPAYKKTHAFTLLMTERLYERFKAVAEEQGYSMNGIATRLVKKYVSLHDIDADGDDLF